MAITPTLEDLKTGRVARVSTSQLAVLCGNSIYTHEKNRCEGKGIPFTKENGRCWYLAPDVLKVLAPEETFKSTAGPDYPKAAHLANLPRDKKTKQFKPVKKSKNKSEVA